MTYQETVDQSCGIPNDLSRSPLPETWGRASSHMGPEGYSPMKRALENKYSAAHFSIMSASMIWACRRVQGHADVRLVEQLAEAVFCFTVHPLYLKPEISYRVMPITKDKSFGDGLMTIFPWVFFAHHFQWPGRWPVYPPLTITSRAIYLTRSSMPKAFEGYDIWTKRIVQKFSVVAHLSDARTSPLPMDTSPELQKAEAKRVMGFPIGPVALDPMAAFDPEANSGDVDQTLRAIDWSANPFLHSPEEMRLAGFETIPYTYQL